MHMWHFLPHAKSSHQKSRNWACNRFPFKMIRSLKWVKSCRCSYFKEPKFLAATFLFYPQLLNLTAFWRKVKLSGPVLREVVIPPQPHDESLGSHLLVLRSQHSWQFDGELPEAILICMWCGRHKRWCSGEWESSAWLLLPTPHRAGAKGQPCSRTGPQFRSITDQTYGSEEKWQFHQAMIILSYCPPVPVP